MNTDVTIIIKTCFFFSIIVDISLFRSFTIMLNTLFQLLWINHIEGDEISINSIIDSQFIDKNGVEEGSKIENRLVIIYFFFVLGINVCGLSFYLVFYFLYIYLFE